jgi:hypothetical protein
VLRVLTTSFLIASLGLLQSQDAWLIVPGGQSGAIKRNTTHADLTRIYGRENVTEGEVNVGEGELERGTILFPNDPNKTLNVLWKDETKIAPRRIQITGERSQWTTIYGITLGTSLKELERLNRRPFRLLGFGWDYSGAVSSWSDGELAGCCEPQSGIYIRLIPQPRDNERSSLQRQVLGDREYSSGHPAMQELNPRVYQIVVDFP